MINLDGDRYIDFQDFKSAVPFMEGCGLKVWDPATSFARIDRDGGGNLLFDEFAQWAISQNLNLVEDDSNLLRIEPEVQVGLSARHRANPRNDATPFALDEPDTFTAKVRQPPQQQKKPRNWDKLANRLPCGKMDVEKLRRIAIFKILDANGNGYLTLTEVTKGIKDILDADQEFDASTAINRAYHLAKTSAAKENDEYVDYSEYKLMLVALRQHFEYLLLFNLPVEEGDRRINWREFQNAAATLKRWGVNVTDPLGEFKSIDKQGGIFVCMHALSRCESQIFVHMDIGFIST